MDTPVHDDRRELLDRLLSSRQAIRRGAAATILPRRPGQPVPLSAEQRHVWLHASVAPQACLYNEAVTIHRRGHFDLAVLERSLNEVLRRHESWRTSYISTSDGIEARVDPRARVPMRFVDLSSLAPEQREQEALRLATEDARRPFDLGQAPLLRALVIRLGPESHRIYLAVHHLIFDGVSLYRVVVPELAAIYGAEERGVPHGLSDPCLQYGDYAVWREQEAQSRAVESALAYWRGKLAGELAGVKLPSDRTSPQGSSGQGSMEVFSLPAELSRRLKALAREQHVTLYALLLASFKVLLHRYSGQEDLLIGGITDMRRRPELAEMVGYFLNGLALRTAPHPASSFVDYLAEVQTTVAEAIDACAAPLDRVVQEVRPNRQGARHPLFQVLFSIQPPPPALPDSWRLTQMDVCLGTAKFDLYLELEDQNERIDGRFLYSTELFEVATIQRMIGHWQTLLEGIVQSPSSKLCSLPLLTEAERAFLQTLNATREACPSVTLPSWFRAQALATPRAIAIEGQGERWSYSELSQRVDQLAAGLAVAGAAPGKLVALAMPRSIQMVASLLAILQSGAAYLPIDPDLPAARTALLLEDAKPHIVLGEGALAQRSDALTFEQALSLGVRAPAAALDPDRDSLAYVLYTSGSTGRPKAVEIEHRSLVNLLESVRRDLNAGARDTLLAVTTLSFDIAALELFLPLISGGRLVVASRAEAADPMRLRKLMEACCCTIIQATPATWRGLVDAGWQGDQRLRLLCGGEALSHDLAMELQARAGEVWNMYGPTETTIWSLSHRVTPADNPVPIGRPLANTRIYIVDGVNNLLPVGAPGELLIAGEGVARGYRGDPALTERKFCRLKVLGGERVYRTGDLARMRADGRLEFLGRTDNQVKIRGFRVGLEEVEAALLAHPQVSAAAAVAAPDASGELALAAFLCGEELANDAIAELREFLRARLPAYMVPGHIVVLPALPLTPNGKVDRKRLPRPQPAAPRAAIRPRDELERQICRIWQEVLRVESIDIRDNFFDLGGHSLLALMAMTRLSKIVGRELPLAILLRAPTVAELAEEVRSQTPAGFSYLMPLKAGSGRPLFIVHGIFGNVLQLKALADCLSTDRAVYGIQARGADPAQEPHATIAEMAEAYLSAIREVQSTGPYALAGYSFGALVAYEMASRLRQAGQEVDLLALLEADLHERYLPLVHRLAYRLTIVRRVARKLWALPRHEKSAYLARKLRQLAGVLMVRQGLQDYPVALEGIGTAPPERLYRMYQLGAREFERFKPAPYDGEVALFRVTGERFDTCNSVPIWRRAAKALRVHDIGGEHDTIMYQPHVRLLADRMNPCLAGISCDVRRNGR